MKQIIWYIINELRIRFKWLMQGLVIILLGYKNRKEFYQYFLDSEHGTFSSKTEHTNI